MPGFTEDLVRGTLCAFPMDAFYLQPIIPHVRDHTFCDAGAIRRINDSTSTGTSTGTSRRRV